MEGKGNLKGNWCSTMEGKDGSCLLEGNILAQMGIKVRLGYRGKK